VAPTSSRGVLVLAWLAQGLIVSAGPSGRSCALYTLHTKGDEGKQRETQGDEGGQRETKGDRGRRMETESQPHPAAPRAKGPPPKHQGPARRLEHLAPSKVAQKSPGRFLFYHYREANSPLPHEKWSWPRRRFEPPRRAGGGASSWKEGPPPKHQGPAAPGGGRGEAPPGLAAAFLREAPRSAVIRARICRWFHRVTGVTHS